MIIIVLTTSLKELHMFFLTKMLHSESRIVDLSRRSKLNLAAIRQDRFYKAVPELGLVNAIHKFYKSMVISIHNTKLSSFSAIKFTVESLEFAVTQCSWHS